MFNESLWKKATEKEKYAMVAALRGPDSDCPSSSYVKVRTTMRIRKAIMTREAFDLPHSVAVMDSAYNLIPPPDRFKLSFDDLFWGGGQANMKYVNALEKFCRDFTGIPMHFMEHYVRACIAYWGAMERKEQ